MTVTVDDDEETSSASVNVTLYEDDGANGSVFTPTTIILFML